MLIPLVMYQNDVYYFFINIGEVKQNLDALMYLDKGGIIIPSKMKKIAFFFLSDPKSPSLFPSSFFE